MKETLTLFAFGVGALCFVGFFIVLKPHSISPVIGPAKAEHCEEGPSLVSRCGRQAMSERE